MAGKKSGTCTSNGRTTYPPHYFRWRAMRSRCLNPKHPEYKRYGARGIRVCKAWLNFKTFQKWCLRTQEAGKSVDRINNDGPYSPVNCRWATPAEQQVTARKTQDRRDGIAVAKKFSILHLHAKYGNPKTREEKLCGECKRIKPVFHFSKNRARSDGRQTRCRVCQRAAR